MKKAMHRRRHIYSLSLFRRITLKTYLYTTDIPEMPFTLRNLPLLDVRQVGRVRKATDRQEAFLNGPSTDPAIQVQCSTGFVIGTRCSCTTEWLLACHHEMIKLIFFYKRTHNGAGALVIEIHIASGY